MGGGHKSAELALGGSGQPGPTGPHLRAVRAVARAQEFAGGQVDLELVVHVAVALTGQSLGGEKESLIDEPRERDGGITGHIGGSKSWCWPEGLEQAGEGLDVRGNVRGR